jgi:hypothetical protein
VLAVERVTEPAVSEALARLVAEAARLGWVLRTVGEMQTLFGPPSAYEQLRQLCGDLEQPGSLLDRPELIDYVERKTTGDQLRIEEVLENEGVEGLSILHVGLGNSSLARRFSARARRIDGLTISLHEKRSADALGLPNYRTHLLSKYSPRLREVGGRFDVVVDNNLASFACCTYHLYVMFDAYLTLLAPGGRILTDLVGMQWSAGDARWKLTFDDLVRLERKLPVVASRITDKVYALTSLRGL